MLTREFFQAGKATFTVENTQSGEYYTYCIRTNTYPNNDAVSRFVSLLTGSDNESDYTYLGMWRYGRFETTKASQLPIESAPCRGIAYVIDVVEGRREEHPLMKIRHEGKCGKCGRKLTTPESLDRGIGPECWARMVG